MFNENSIFSKNLFSLQNDNKEISNDFQEKENYLINILLVLIHYKRENNFFKNKLKKLQNIIGLNNFEKRIQKNPIEISMWLISEKDKLFKEKLNLLNSENNKTDGLKKKKKIKNLLKSPKNELEENLNENRIDNNHANSSLLNLNSKNHKKNNLSEYTSIIHNKIDLEDFSINSNSTNFKFDIVNKTSKEDKNIFDFSTKNFIVDNLYKKNKTNIKKIKK